MTNVETRVLRATFTFCGKHPLPISSPWIKQQAGHEYVICSLTPFSMISVDWGFQTHTLVCWVVTLERCKTRILSWFVKSYSTQFLFSFCCTAHTILLAYDLNICDFFSSNRTCIVCEKRFFCSKLACVCLDLTHRLAAGCISISMPDEQKRMLHINDICSSSVAVQTHGSTDNCYFQSFARYLGLTKGNNDKQQGYG